MGVGSIRPHVAYVRFRDRRLRLVSRRSLFVGLAPRVLYREAETPARGAYFATGGITGRPLHRRRKAPIRPPARGDIWRLRPEPLHLEGASGRILSHGARRFDRYPDRRRKRCRHRYGLAALVISRANRTA